MLRQLLIKTTEKDANNDNSESFALTTGSFYFVLLSLVTLLYKNKVLIQAQRISIYFYLPKIYQINQTKTTS